MLEPVQYDDIDQLDMDSEDIHGNLIYCSRMTLNKCIEEDDNPDITEERYRATFDTDEMASIIWESKEIVKTRKRITQLISERPELHDEKIHMKNRLESIMNGARKITTLMGQLNEICDPRDYNQLFHTLNEVIGIEGHPLSLHLAMVIPTMETQGDEEQKTWWLNKLRNFEIIATYAQTEMGHGTNLRKLETTATYDKASQEFVLHSPTLTSLKWWPGNLGKSANHAIVAAVLYIDGKNLGTHNFFVQLRDLNTHKVLPGITVGDIGPKLAYNGTDNGYLKFHDYRIPRRHLLAKYAKVAPDGTYTKPSHAKIGYSAMVHVRSHMISQHALLLAYGNIVAIRYSAVRKQGEIREGSREVKILEYQTQQHRLFPQLAKSFAFMFAGQETIRAYKKIMKNLSTGNLQVAHLADLHALTSGLKAVVTHQVGQGIEQCRMACGGHGYSRASYLPDIYGIAIGGCTYEGENMVMLLQLARYLMKGAQLALTGAELPPLLSYLKKAEQPCRIGNSSEPEVYLCAFEHIARGQIFKTAERMAKLERSGCSKEDAWNRNAVEMTRASRLHTHLFIATAFATRVHSVSDHSVRRVLTDLLLLYLNYDLISFASYLTEDDYLSTFQLHSMKDHMYQLLAKIRPNAVSLVDSWNISDRELKSVLGRRDGRVYEHLYKWAQASQLNEHEVLPSYDKYLKPMMDRARERSKL